MPDCYRRPVPKLKAGYFGKFQIETLFYIFYSMPGDEAQVFAADELCTRNWAYHKELKVASLPYWASTSVFYAGKESGAGHLKAFIHANWNNATAVDSKFCFMV